MIRTIQQRIYVVGLLPLAVLAVALLSFNGFARIKEAHRELRNTQRVTAALLQSPAADALIVGNTLAFEQTVRSVIKTSPRLICVVLRDAERQLVTHVGRCDRELKQTDYFAITVPAGGFSDFKESPGADVQLGQLGLSMDNVSVVAKRRQVFIQLIASLALIALVSGFIGRLLRARLIEPIQRIGAAMQSLSHQDYSARVPVHGDDELTRLAEAINQTISTVASYTRELERRRSDADRALQDADEANLARGGLVRSLTEDLEGPLGEMHSRLTEIAMINHDAELRTRIKEVVALLQRAQADFADLIEIAGSTQRIRKPAPLGLAEMLSEIERDIGRLVDAENIPVHFAMTRLPSAHIQNGKLGSILLHVDANRFKRALVYLIRAMSRRCRSPGIHGTVELLMLSNDHIHISVHLKAFYDPTADAPILPRLDELGRYGNGPALMGWTDRETKIIDYLLRTVGIEPTISVSPTGAVSILLAATCRYTVEHGGRPAATDATATPNSVAATLVSNDDSLLRLTRRGDISNIELKLLPFSRALSEPASLRSEAALLIDISDDVSEAVTLIERLKAAGRSLPYLIAICPPGQMTESLGERLLELGFNGTIQKPLPYGRVVQIIRMALADPLNHIHRNSRPME
jgi:signal transduction histidine kinase